MKHTVRPARNQLFCRPDEAETKTASGIILTEKAAEKPRTAVVINIGDEVIDYQRDDRIIYKSYTTNEIKIDGEDFFLVDEEDVLGALVEIEE